jgi:hypothetical protein
MRRFLDELTGEQKWIVWTLATLVLFLIFTAIFPDIGVRKTPRSLGAGRTVDVGITLVTADSRDLACASDETVAGARCLYDAKGTLRDGLPTGDEAGRAADVLAPYMTTDNVLFLVPGLFAEPAIAKRFAEEPPTVSRDRLKRFTAHCQLKIEARAKDLAVRWEPTAAFGPQPDGAWVGRVSSCSIEAP